METITCFPLELGLQIERSHFVDLGGDRALGDVRFWNLLLNLSFTRLDPILTIRVDVQHGVNTRQLLGAAGQLKTSIAVSFSLCQFIIPSKSVLVVEFDQSAHIRLTATFQTTLHTDRLKTAGDGREEKISRDQVEKHFFSCNFTKKDKSFLVFIWAWVHVVEK